MNRKIRNIKKERKTCITDTKDQTSQQPYYYFSFCLLLLCAALAADMQSVSTKGTKYTRVQKQKQQISSAKRRKNNVTKTRVHIFHRLDNRSYDSCNHPVRFFSFCCFLDLMIRV